MSYWQSGGGGAPQVHDHSDASEGGNIPQESVTGLPAALAGKAASAHVHDAGDISGLQAPSDFSVVLSAMLESAAESPAMTTDLKVESGEYVGLYYAVYGNPNGYSAEASNAQYTMPSGKTGRIVAFAGLNGTGGAHGPHFMRSGFSGTILDRTLFPDGSIRWANIGGTAISAGWVATMVVYGDGGGTGLYGGWVLFRVVDA